jgi:hypothetical protein
VRADPNGSRPQSPTSWEDGIQFSWSHFERLSTEHRREEARTDRSVSRGPESSKTPSGQEAFIRPIDPGTSAAPVHRSACGRASGGGVRTGATIWHTRLIVRFMVSTHYM